MLEPTSTKEICYRIIYILLYGQQLSTDPVSSNNQLEVGLESTKIFAFKSSRRYINRHADKVVGGGKITHMAFLQFLQRFAFCLRNTLPDRKL